MLSVLIPVYNFDVRDLVYTLSVQAENLKIPYEIIVIDDASINKFRELNASVKANPGVCYTEEEINLGRSRIRNKLADKAKYNNLLYLDCDSMIDNPEFLKNYLAHLDYKDVIYGGRKYIQHKPSDNRLLLHWLYGIRREQIPVRIRAAEPNKSFMTNNFMISREAINRVRFNERMRGYGHEDTLFGYDLFKCKIAIEHIDNPVIHMGLESNEEFLRKTREGIKNLKRILSINGNEKKLVKEITLLSYYKKFRDLGLADSLKKVYLKYEYLLRKNLLSSNPNLFLFDLYKLGYLFTLTADRE